MKVYVVSFTPAAEDLSSVGGWEWRYTLKDAEAVYDEMLADQEKYSDTHIIRLVEIDVPDQIRTVTDPDKRRDVVDFYVEMSVDEFESTLPALRQHVPDGADPDWIPLGGVA